MTQRELYDFFEAALPAALACPWDHDGVQVMTEGGRPVRRVLATLDVSERVVDYAVENGIDLIVSHHPLLFRPLYALTSDTPVGRILAKLTANGIALFSFHTRADKAEGGVSDLLARRLGLTDVEPLETEEGPLARVGTLPAYVKLADYAASVKESLACDGVLLAAADPNRSIRRIAVSGGEGGDFVEDARRAGADLFISGRIGYHRMLDACEGGMALLEAGHYFTEREVIYYFAALIKQADPDIEIVTYAPKSLALV